MSFNSENLTSRLGFIMMTAGCAIGLGNVWRFPSMAGQYGGAYFVLFYLLFLILMGIPLMTMELSLGRASRSGICGAMEKLPAQSPRTWLAFGTFAFTGNIVLMMLYTTVAGWMLAYCVDFSTGSMQNAVANEVSQAAFSSMLNSPGKMIVYMLLITVSSAAVCAIGLQKGVERITKYLMAGLFLLLFSLSIYGLTLPGMKEGLRFYLMPDMEMLQKNGIVNAITGAMSQAFFTLSLGQGCIAAFGSYTKSDRRLAGEAVLITICDTIVALFAGFIIFPACFSFNVPVDSGPGLIFVTLPPIFNQLNGGRLLGAVFFLFMMIAALTTVITVFECIIAFVMDRFHISRGKASWITFAGISLASLPCLFGFNLLSWIHPLGQGSTILDLEDWFMCEIIMPTGALTIILFCTRKFGWGWKNFQEEANTGSGLAVPGWTRFYLTWILPCIVFAIMSVSMWNRFFRQ